MSDKILEVKDLTIQYKTDLEVVEAVNHLSFSIRENETLGLVGETGAGKTTTALGIMRIIPTPAEKERAGHERHSRRADLHDFPGPHDRPQSGADHRRTDY